MFAFKLVLFSRYSCCPSFPQNTPSAGSFYQLALLLTT
jgi:hypothetical protein